MRFLFVCAACAGLLLSACQPLERSASTAPGDTASVHEVTPRPLRLGAPLDQADMEISGLAWHGDTLVVLPQFPARRADETPRLYGIPRSVLERAVADSTTLIRPIPIPLKADGMSRSSIAYEGCEAIAFAGNRTYVLVEGNGNGAGMEGILFQGTVAPGLRSIHIRESSAQSLPMQAALQNMSYEALTLRGDTVLALFEANGERVNASPQIRRYDDTLRAIGSLPFPTLEYRLTDATALDAENRFWVTNYFYPGERALLNPATDSLAVRFAQGSTHRSSDVVERLVEYRYTPSGIRRTDTPPLWFELGGGTGRNWEGVVRFGDGFLVATDKFPSTILAYVPRSRS